MGKLFNRAKMTVSGTPGTGTITLLAAAAGFQTFASAGVANGDIVSYVIEDGTNWEYGQGTYTSSGTTLARTTVQGSSNAGSAISATSSALVFASALAADILTQYQESPIAVGSAVSLTTGTAANLTSLSLGTGDWDVAVLINFRTAATTGVKTVVASVTTSSATWDTAAGAYSQTTYSSGYITPNIADLTAQLIPRRFSLTSTTTVYGTAWADFNTSTLSAWGLLRARRFGG